MKVTHRIKSGGFSDQVYNLDIISLSHLRWDFVYQRPQHLLSRAARKRRVFFFEEPVYHHGKPRLDLQKFDLIIRAVPYLPFETSEAEKWESLTRLLNEMINDQKIENFILWYYTPMALKFSRHLEPLTTVYDCMDQLSHFKDAPQDLPFLERELLRKANLVFTGGLSLYEEKRSLHTNIHLFPSSVDVEHFSKSKALREDPEDQASIPHPRIGYMGVIDERIDLKLLGEMSSLRHDWHFIMLGPIIKIDECTLPKRHNIHYLGGKSYLDLPHYLSGWDIAMLPFARNDATRYISPTKTPEYLAAGKKVISTSIRDVVRPYGDLGLVAIADKVEDFIESAEALMNSTYPSKQWPHMVDEFLGRNSWDRTYAAMWNLIERECIKSIMIHDHKKTIPNPRINMGYGIFSSPS